MRTQFRAEAHPIGQAHAITLALFAAVAAGFTLIAALTSVPVMAGESPALASATGEPVISAPRRIEPRKLLGLMDEIATLEAMQIALSDVGDGGTYVWHRDHGRLSGIFRPISSHFDLQGRVCRKLEMTLSSGAYAREAEAVACRDGFGLWGVR